MNIAVSLGKTFLFFVFLLNWLLKLSCVEVPILASKRGLDPLHVGPLPTQLALLNYINATCDELTVEGSLTGDPQKIYHAICYDPLTSSVLSLAEIKEMVKEMFKANEDWLPQFKNRDF